MSTSSPNRFRLTLAAALVSVFPVFAQQKPFTLEQAMSSPFPEELVAAPTGGKIAWVFDAQGRRNVWVAGPPDYEARQVTSYSEDDGQEISELRWTPDAQTIVYVRGGDFEMMREYPNPRSFPQGVEQDVWVVSAGGGPARKLAEGHSPAVSPQGDRVAFIFKHQVWLVKLDGSEKAAQLIHSNGESESLRWSPEGSLLAFRSNRGDHSFVGVYSFADQSLRYLDPSADRDTYFTWSPDGKQIAFVRLPATREASAFGPKRAAQPWSIRVADVAGATGREVWQAEPGTGSVFHGLAGDVQLIWGSDDRLVLPWERDGWTHLYSVPATGGKATLLTPGNFEVEHVSLSPDRREIVFSSNQDDIDRRHIWRAPVAGGKATRVTSGSGIEWSPVMTSDGKVIAIFRSDARRPARPAIVAVAAMSKSPKASGGEDAAATKPRDLSPEAIPPDFPSQELVDPQPVVFSAADGLRIHAQVFLPIGLRSGERRPAVIFFHGGSRRQMLLGWHYMHYYHNAYALNQYLASRGYVVLSANYRSGTGFGMEFREALNYGATGASEFNDVLGAGLYMRGRPDVDPQRIGIWGGSYGGYLTALGLARASDLFAAGVDLHGVHDWNVEIRNFVPAYDPQANPDAARIAFESSPLGWVKTWRSPVLLVHGDDDRNVPFTETVRLVEALRRQGVEFRQLVFPDEVHAFLTHAHWLAAYHAASDFLDAHLGKKD